MQNKEVEDIEIESFINTTEGPYDELETIGKQVQQYNVYDFLCRLAALNCIPANQNKEVLICGLIEVLLSYPKADYNSFPIMSHNRFKQIIKDLEKTKLASAVDPAEGPVIQTIIWNGKTFSCFPGMDKDSVFRLQRLLQALETLSFSNSVFWRDMKSIILLTLSIQDTLANWLCSSDRSITDEKYSKSIQIYTNIETKDLIKTISIKEFSTWKQNLSSTIWESMDCKFGQEKSDDIDNYSFYKTPFIYVNEALIPLDIGILPDYLFRKIIEIAQGYSIAGKLIKRYNEIVFNNCSGYLETLGHKSTKQNLIKEDEYSKEVVFTAFESDYLIVEFIKERVIPGNNELIAEISDGKRCIELSQHILKEGADRKQLNYLILFNTSGLSLSCIYFDTSSLLGCSIVLKPFELQCISINESDKEDFIPRFSKAYENINGPLKLLTHPLCVIQYYKNNGYSFYRDDMDVRKAFMLFDFSLSEEYITKALKRHSKTLVPYYINGIYVEATEIDDIRKIYAFPGDIRIEKCVSVNGFYIWLISHEKSISKKENVINTVIDILTYWIGENSEQISLSFHFSGVIPIIIELPDDENEYFIWKETNTESPLSVSFQENHITISFTAENYRQLSRFDNNKEKELFIAVINCLFSIVGIRLPIDDFTAFANPQKMLVDFSFVSNKIYLKPIETAFNSRCIHEDDINILLDEIGDYICNSTPKRIFTGSDCISILESILAYLFDKLFSIINTFNPLTLLHMAYEDMENTIYKSRTMEHRLLKDITCYPEKKEFYLSESSETNRLSLSLKCLIEVLSSTNIIEGKCRPVICRKEYEFLLAICNLVITWGRTRDAMAQKLIKQEISILASGRIGIDYSEFDYFSTVSNEFRSIDTPYEPDSKEPDFIAKYYDEIDLAYKNDYGYSLSEKIVVLHTIARIKLDDELVHSCNKEELVKHLREELPSIPPNIISRIIDASSMFERTNYFSSPKGYEKRDILPWKFTRQYSFIRKPIIAHGDYLCWGSRNVSFLAHEEIGLIYTSKLRTANTSNVKTILGKISKDRSDFFNDYIYRTISNYNDFLVLKNVKKDSKGRRIVDNDGFDLGDIDILALNQKTNTIIVIEVKNYSFSRNNPDEIYSELQKIGVFYKKHLRRVLWTINNKEEICKLFNVNINTRMKVKETMITRTPVLARHLLDKSINVIAAYELTEERLNSLPNRKRVNLLHAN